MFLNIGTIMNRGEKHERMFFQFLNIRKIQWSQIGNNLKNIYLWNKSDFETVKETYPEVKENKDLSLPPLQKPKEHCIHCGNELCDKQILHEQCFVCDKKPLE
jgi:hypothetical protein